MTKTRMKLYEVEAKGQYHQYWLALSQLDAARRAIDHAQECGRALDQVSISTMVQPDDPGNGGLVYVVNDTRTYAIKRGHIRRADLPDESRSAAGKHVN